MFVLILSFKLLFLGAGWIGRKKRGNKHKLGFYRMFTADSNNTDNSLHPHSDDSKSRFPRFLKKQQLFYSRPQKTINFYIIFSLFWKHIGIFKYCALEHNILPGRFPQAFMSFGWKTSGFHWILYGHWHWYSLAWSHSVLKSCARAFAGFSQ